MKKSSMSIVCTGTLLLLFGTAHAAVWYVHPDSTLNSIQTALNSSADGDTVLVGPGTYTENIVWPNTQGIDLISEYGPDTTVIDGDSLGRVICIDVAVDTMTHIDGFTITNGYSTLYGAGIYCGFASPTITNNIVTANRAAGGYTGGAIACFNESSPIIHANTISDNYSTWGGGILCRSYSNPTITGNIIHNNSADSIGGGILNYIYCNAKIENNEITNNHARWGAGIGITTNSSPAVRGNTITGNGAYLMGGGIYCYQWTTALIEDNEISNNSSGVSDWGGGIRCSPAGDAVIRHCRISNNSTIGVSIAECSPDIDSCTIELHTSAGVKIFAGTLPTNPTINWCNIVDNPSYGLISQNTAVTINAENNWWGDTTGPYHSTMNPGGLGDRIAGNVDFDPWLMDPVQNIGLEESPAVKPVGTPAALGATIFSGPLQLPEGKTCRVFDITGRVVEPNKIQPGIYFVEIDGKVVQKVVKVR